VSTGFLSGPGPLGWGLPAGLWGLLALAIPLAVHLLVRTRAPRVPVATLRFFRPRPPARTRLTPPRDRWLLALRLTLVALAALALSDPWFRPSPGEVRGDEEVAEEAPAPDRGAEGVARGEGPVTLSGDEASGPEMPSWPGPRGWGEFEASHPQVAGVLERLGVPLPRLGRGADGLALVAALHRRPEGAGTLGPRGSPWLNDGGSWILEGGAAPGEESGQVLQGEPLRVEPAMNRFPDDPGTALFLHSLARVSLRNQPTSRPPRAGAEGRGLAAGAGKRGAEGQEPETGALVREAEGPELEAEVPEQEAAALEEGVATPAPGKDPRPLRRLAWGAVLLLLLVEGRVRGGAGTAPREAREAPGGGR
jgi:hypothetical protein